MKLLRTLIYLAAVATVIFVVSVVSRSSSPPAVEGSETPRPTKVQREESAVGGGRLDVVKMTPAAWQEIFEEEPPPIPPATREDILHLSGELQESLANGTDPRSEEARVYVDAIRELLEYRGD